MAQLKPVRQHPPVRWPDKRKGPWSISFSWLEVDGRYECVGVEVWKGIEPWREYETPDQSRLVEGYRGIPGAKPEPIAAAKIRDIPIASLISDAWRDMVALHQTAARLLEKKGDSGDTAASLRRLGSKFSEPPEPTRGRPKLYGPDHFARVAEVYADAWINKVPPTSAVANRFGVSYSTAAKWVSRARQEFGLLPETRAGKARGVTKAPSKRNRKS